MTPNKIIRSKRKTISITINEDAELVVRAPKKLEPLQKNTKLS